MIVNQNLFEIPAERISESIVLDTVFGSETVYANDAAIDNFVDEVSEPGSMPGSLGIH